MPQAGIPRTPYPQTELARPFQDVANQGVIDVHPPKCIYDLVFESDITDSDCDSTLNGNLDFLRHPKTYGQFFVAPFYLGYGPGDSCSLAERQPGLS